MLSRIRPATLLLFLFLAAALPGAGEAQEAQPGATTGGAEAAAQDQEEARPTKRQPETLLEFAIAGGWVMLILCICSIVWVGFFVERLIVLRRKKVIPQELIAGLRNLLGTMPFDRDRASALVGQHPSPAATIFKAAIERLHLPLERIEKGVHNAATQEIFQLRDRLWIFATVSTVAPLLGLLGTVIGLVQTFREVAVSGLGAGATLAPGIYEALVTTVGGLATAIPALVIYYWLQARVDAYVHEIDRMVVEIVDTKSAHTA